MVNLSLPRQTLFLPVVFLLSACGQSTASHHAVSGDIWIEEGSDELVFEEDVYSETYPAGKLYEYIEPVSSLQQRPRRALSKAAVVAAHNRWRAAVGVPPLSWSDYLADTAQSWADYLSGSGGCLIQHSNSGYGENILQATPIIWADGRTAVQKKTAADVIDSWAGEIKDYDYFSNSCRADLCGHYKQIVWRTTRKVGCAVSICPNKGQVWVCHYDPTGNVAGRRPY